MFSCQRAKKSIVLGHFSFQFELWFFLIWSWSIPVGVSEIRCSARIFAVSKTAATDHSRHESTKCEQDSKCGRSAQTDARVRISPYETDLQKPNRPCHAGNRPVFADLHRYHLLLRNASQAGQWNYWHPRHSGSGDVFPKERLDPSDHCVPVQSHGTAHDCGLDSERASRYVGNAEKHLNSSSGVNMAPGLFSIHWYRLAFLMESKRQLDFILSSKYTAGYWRIVILI